MTLNLHFKNQWFNSIESLIICLWFLTNVLINDQMYYNMQDKPIIHIWKSLERDSERKKTYYATYSVSEVKKFKNEENNIQKECESRSNIKNQNKNQILIMFEEFLICIICIHFIVIIEKSEREQIIKSLRSFYIFSFSIFFEKSEQETNYKIHKKTK